MKPLKTVEKLAPVNTSPLDHLHPAHIDIARSAIIALIEVERQARQLCVKVATIENEAVDLRRRIVEGAKAIELAHATEKQGKLAGLVARVSQLSQPTSTMEG